MSYRIGFIGAGNMGGALIVAACRSIGPEQVVITDHDQAKAQALAGQTGCALAQSNDEIVQNADYIVLAVKPHIMRGVVRALAPALSQRMQRGKPPVLVTIAAGISTGTIQECVNDPVHVIRIMPNTPVMVGKGTILLTGSPETAREELEEFQSLLAWAGSFERLAEGDFDKTTSISGCTPAYVYMFIDALADGAVQMGVPREQAKRLAAQTVLGAAAMVLETGEHPDQLKDNVCSPGGSTIVGVTALEKHGFRYAVAQSIIASTEKNAQLGAS